MLYDPGVWLFGLAVALFLAGVVGVVLSTRRVPPDQALDLPGLTANPRAERQLLQLEAEVERLRAERDELQSVLGRLASLLERRYPQLSAERRRAHLVATGDDRERRAGGS